MIRLFPRIIFCMLLTSVVLARDLTSHSYGLGTMFLRENSVYVQSTGKNLFLPYLYLHYKYIQWDGLSGKADFFNKRFWQAGFDIEYLPESVSRNFSDQIGMSEDKKEDSIVAGVYYKQYVYDSSYHFLVKWQRVLFGALLGNRYIFQIGREFDLPMEGRLYLKLSLIFLNQEYVDYYYGVPDYYEAEATSKWHLASRFIHPISLEWMFFFDLDFVRMGSSITESPLVLRSQVLNWKGGVYYTF